MFLRLFGVLVAAICITVGCSYRDISEQKFSDMDEAKRKGALGPGGWLPAFLPLSANDVRLVTNIDTNETFVSFGWNGTDRGAIDTLCRPASVSDADVPTSLGRNLPKRLFDKKSESLACANHSYVILITTDHRGYYWQTTR